MLYIKKGIPPREMSEKVIEITKTNEWKSAKEDNTDLLRSYFDLLDKQLIRESLVEEQHGLCAYCMKRIEPNDKMNIEHYRPVNGHKEKALDYNNMLGCCKGGSDKGMYENRVLCCDAAKKNQKITINPREKAMMDKTRYRKDGRIYIYPENPVLQKDIDQVLCLNGKLNKDGSLKQDTSTHIVLGRREAYRRYEFFMRELNKKYSGNESKIQSCVLKKISEIENMKNYPEYAGVLLFFLRRRAHGITVHA